jgi:hypothetical protein
MLPSNSRFQRLSQAALSRSRFLQLAAGALLPFVGLRLGGRRPEPSTGAERARGRQRLPRVTPNR